MGVSVHLGALLDDPNVHVETPAFPSKLMTTPDGRRLVVATRPRYPDWYTFNEHEKEPCVTIWFDMTTGKYVTAKVEMIPGSMQLFSAVPAVDEARNYFHSNMVRLCGESPKTKLYQQHIILPAGKMVRTHGGTPTPYIAFWNYLQATFAKIALDVIGYTSVIGGDIGADASVGEYSALATGLYGKPLYGPRLPNLTYNFLNYASTPIAAFNFAALVVSIPEQDNIPLFVQYAKTYRETVVKSMDSVLAKLTYAHAVMDAITNGNVDAMNELLNSPGKIPSSFDTKKLLMRTKVVDHHDNANTVGNYGHGAVWDHQDLKRGPRTEKSMYCEV